MRVLFVQKDTEWLNKFKKSFNGNYKNHQFDFRRSPRSALGRFICGQSYDVVLVDYGWSVNGLKKQLKQINPSSSVYFYSQMQCKLEDCQSDIIKKDINNISMKLAESGIISNDNNK